MKVYYGTFSECGPRQKNEDYIAVREMPEQGRSVFVLCDGMGGHDCGEVASRLVAEHICDFWAKNPKRKDCEKKIIDACKETMIAYNNRSRVEMGTTMAMTAVEGNKALLAHCGDSRIYVIRDNKIIYQSVDHVALTPEGWPIITRAFFTGQNNYKPDIEEIEVQVGDMIFICSDGVYGNGKWSELQDVLTEESYIYPLMRIRDIASEPAHDNYSAILIRIGNDEPEDKADSSLVTISRRLRGSNDRFEYVEYFRTRREGRFRLVELNCFSRDREKYEYGIYRYPERLDKQFGQE